MLKCPIITDELFYREFAQDVDKMFSIFNEIFKFEVLHLKSFPSVHVDLKLTCVNVTLSLQFGSVFRITNLFMLIWKFNKTFTTVRYDFSDDLLKCFTCRKHVFDNIMHEKHNFHEDFTMFPSPVS